MSIANARIGRLRPVIIAQFHDSRTGIAFVSTSPAAELWTMMPGAAELFNLRWTRLERPVFRLP